jgi:hypothetical protein
VISLPSLVIDIQEDGEIVIAETPVVDLAAAFDQDLALEPLNPAIVDLLVRSNIQHIQIDNAPSGPLLLINGEAIPSIHWDESSLTMLGLVLEVLSGEENGLDVLLPIVRQLGVGLTVRLPIAPEAEPIPLAVTGESSAAGRALARQANWLEIREGEPLRLKLRIHYSADGRASLKAADEGVLSLLGIPLHNLDQSAETMQAIHELGIETLTLSSNQDGIALAINDQPLPSIAWTEGELSHLLTVALQVGLQEPADEFNRLIVRVLNFVERLLPIVQTSDLTLEITFEDSGIIGFLKRL